MDKNKILEDDFEDMAECYERCRRKALECLEGMVLIEKAAKCVRLKMDKEYPNEGKASVI